MTYPQTPEIVPSGNGCAAKTRAVYVEYRKAGYSKKFRAEHEADILIHQAAKKYLVYLSCPGTRKRRYFLSRLTSTPAASSFFKNPSKSFGFSARAPSTAMRIWELQARAAETTERFNALSSQIKELESQMNENGELQKQIVSSEKRHGAVSPSWFLRSVPGWPARYNLLSACHTGYTYPALAHGSAGIFFPG